MSRPPTPRDLVSRLRDAGHDERLATGGLYLEAADCIEQLYGEACRYRFLRDNVTGLIEATDKVDPKP